MTKVQQLQWGAWGTKRSGIIFRSSADGKAEFGGRTLGKDPSVAEITSVYLFFCNLIVLLCHKVRRCVLRWQHGHLGMVRAMARAMTTRKDVIELRT